MKNVVELDIAEIEAIEAAEIVSELGELQVEQRADAGVDMAQALAQANGFDETKVIEAAAQDQADEQAAEQDQALPYADRVKAVSDERAADVVAEFAAQWASRAAFENAKNPDNSNIQKRLSKEIVAHAAIGMAKFYDAAKVDFGYMNKSGTKNIYAPEKVRDILRAAALHTPLKNAVNIAVVWSLFKLADNGIDFNGELAKGATSDKCFAPVNFLPYMRRHTVSASTASTQSSSTMTALEVAGVVVNVGSEKSQIWRIADTPIAKALKAAVYHYHSPI